MDNNTNTLQTDVDATELQLLTGAQPGKLPTPETIRQGTVQMEVDPNYEATVQKARDAGFQIKFITRNPSVKIIHIYDTNGHLIQVEKVLYLQKKMRYLDLEHEVGHIDQLGRFGNQMPPTDKVVALPNGRRTSAPSQKGVLTTWQNRIMEYHNRLIEFLRLYERRVDVDLLKEHAKGVDNWRDRYWYKGVKEERSPTRTKWANKYFGEIKELAEKYSQAMETINSGRYPPI